MLYLPLVLNRMQSSTSFGGPTPKPVSLTVLLQRLMLVGYAVLLLALPPPADTTSQFRCLPRTQHILVDQENLEDGMITSLLQLLVLQLHIWKKPVWTWILHT